MGLGGGGGITLYTQVKKTLKNEKRWKRGISFWMSATFQLFFYIFIKKYYKKGIFHIYMHSKREISVKIENVQKADSK